MSTCDNCGAPIVWATEKGGHRVPLDIDPGGVIALLRGELVVHTTHRGFDALPASWKQGIPAEAVGVWRAALDGPRYRFHSVECRRAIAQARAMHIGGAL